MGEVVKEPTERWMALWCYEAPSGAMGGPCGSIERHPEPWSATQSHTEDHRAMRSYGELYRVRKGAEHCGWPRRAMEGFGFIEGQAIFCEAIENL